MKVIWILVFVVFAGAGLLIIGTGASYLLAEQTNIVQQDTAASLATAHFVAGWLCWWLAAGANRQYGKLEEASQREWEMQYSSTLEGIGNRRDRPKTTWEQRKE